MKILLASPRGFCAGVDRAIGIVEQALDRADWNEAVSLDDILRADEAARALATDAVQRQEQEHA